jgi:glycosyltransferase involved in cell wall biosynthesis
MRHVLIFTYYWPPSGGAGVQRWLKFAKFLPEFGWEPIIITVDPEKATYPILDETLQQEIGAGVKVIKTDSKEWFSVYKKVSRKESVPYSGFANESEKVSLASKVARFIRGNFFLPDPRKGWNKFALQAAEKVISDYNISCIITTAPPHSTHLIAAELKKNYNIPWIADFRDLWTEIYYYKQFYPTYFAHKANLRMEKMILKNADCITTVSPTLQTMLGSKIEEQKDKVKVLTNGFDPDNFINQAIYDSKQFVVTYIGTMTSIYPIDAFLNAFKDLIKVKPNSLFRAIGTISDDQKNKIASLPQENHELISYVNHKTAISYLYKTSVLLLLIPSHFSNNGIVTGKLFEYLAVGKPVLYLGPRESDGAAMVNQGKSGRVIESSDAAAIFETLQEWENDRPNVVQNESFSRKKLSQNLVGIINTLAPE